MGLEMEAGAGLGICRAESAKHTRVTQQHVSKIPQSVSLICVSPFVRV